MGRSPPIADTRARRQKPGQPCRATPRHLYIDALAAWLPGCQGDHRGAPGSQAASCGLTPTTAATTSRSAWPRGFFHTPPLAPRLGLQYPLLGAQQFSGSAEVALSYEDIYRIYRIYRIYHIYRTLWCPCVRFAWLVTGFACSVTSFAFCVTDFGFGVWGSVVSTVLTKTRFA